MEVDMRSESPSRLDGIDKILHAAVQRGLKEENLVKSRGAELSVNVKLVGDRPSGGIDATAPLVQRSIAMAKYLGATPRLGVSSTNSNIPFSRNVPSVTIGRGGVGGGAHALDEWWINDNGHLAIQGALLLVLAEAGMVK
jgi:di/tripeptidase